jgi:hypothetical protein
MKARRGSTLFVTIAVMFFFAVLCGAVIGMAQMNVTYNSFFERRGVLEQATSTFAGALAKVVKEKKDEWWPSGIPAAKGEGVYTTPAGEELPSMQFFYFISPDKLIYTLFVRGEYAADQNIVWGVSVDVSSTATDVWSKIVRIM